MLTGATADITAVVTGTSNKSVVWSVCNGNGASCVVGGNSTVGTIMQIGLDSQGNSIARYTAPATVPAPPDCRAETGGCSVVLQGFLTAFDVSCFARVTVESSTNPIPTITSLVPPSAIVGGAAFTLTVNGTGFVASSVVRWEGSDRATTFINSTQLQAAIPASDIAATGTANVTVFNPPPDGGESNMAVFNINNPAPILTLLSPSTAVAGGVAFTLTITGTGFIPASEVRWNGSPRTTAFETPTEVTADIPASDIAAVGTAMVTVVNPAPGGGTSNPLTFTISSGFTAAVEWISLSMGGTQGNGVTAGPPAVSAGGRFVVFQSVASDLVAGDTDSFVDVFVRDTCIGGPMGCTPGTTRESVATDGTTQNLSTFAVSPPAITPDGRFVVFTSFASNLVPGDTSNEPDIFVRDTCVGAPMGCTVSTTRANLTSAGGEANDGAAVPGISADGRFVVFGTNADNLITGDTNGDSDIYVRDTCEGAPMGCTPATVRVSVTSAGAQLSFAGGFPVISAGGRFVVFASDSPNLGASPLGDIFLHDRDVSGDGTFDEAGDIATIKVSPASDAGLADAPHANNFTDVSADGRFVAFESNASNLITGDTNGATDVFVRDTCIGAAMGCTPATMRVSVATDGSEADDLSAFPSISDDGRFVAFTSLAGNLVPDDTNGAADVFVRDTCVGAPMGCVPSTRRVSLTVDGNETGSDSFQPAISPDGLFVGFLSDGALDPADSTTLPDIYLALPLP